MELTRVGIIAIACAMAAAPGCGGRQGAGSAPAGGQGTTGSDAPPARGPASSIAPEAPPPRLDAAVKPLRHAAVLDIDPAAETFGGEVTLDIELAEARSRIWLHAAELEIASATLTRGKDTWKVSVARSQDPGTVSFELGRKVEPGPVSLRVAYRGRMSAKETSGVFRRQDGDRWYVYTQFEPLDARRAFPCFDEPRFKVPWELTIHVPEGQVAVSNMPAEEAAGPRPGTRTFRFAATPPVPSYLVAFAVGPFEFVDLGRIGRGKTPARIVVPRGRTAEARYAAEATPGLLARLEDYLDIAYPYAKLDSIAMPHFGSGAMEHPGLVTYNMVRILRAPAEETVYFRLGYARLATHELAHQWFGNLVTPAWWDDLWLSESFATWMEAKVLAGFEPAWDAGVLAALDAEEAFFLDSLQTTRKLHQPIDSSNDIFSAFDDITYEKGSAVLGMFERWLGADRFRAGVQAYLRAHANGNATAGDFVAALAGATQPEVEAAVHTFLDQTGVPVISADLVCEPGEPPSIELAQERYLPAGSAGSTTDRTWHVPVCLKYGQSRGPAGVREQCMLLTEEADTMVLTGARRCPDWLLTNAGAAGYYRSAYAIEMQSALLGPARRHLSVPERVRLAHDIIGSIRSGNLEMGEALAMVPALLADPSEYVAVAAVELVAGMRAHLVPAALRPNHDRFVRKTFGARARALGWQSRPKDSLAARTLREALLGLVARDAGEPALVEQARRMAATWLEQRQGIEPELLAVALATASAHGDAAFHARLESALRATTDLHQRGAILTALASARDPARVRANLDLVLSGAVEVHEVETLLFVPLGEPETRDAVERFIAERWDALVEKLPRDALASLIDVSAAFCDKEHLDRLESFFGPKAASILGGPTALAQSRESVQLCMTGRDLQQPSVEAFLKKQ
jgi:alanyl aminopeptidase